MFELNPFLARLPEPAKGGENFIEEPTRVENIVIQTRGQALSPFEDRLAVAMMQAFEAGCTQLPDLAATLNANGCGDAQGAVWTADSLALQLAQSANLFEVREVRS